MLLSKTAKTVNNIDLATSKHIFPNHENINSKHLKIITNLMMTQFFIQVSEEMVALLAFIGFYIFGVCCYKICTGFSEDPSNERK